jgi:hypothetical protein
VKPEIIIFLFFLAGLISYELVTGKILGRYGGVFRRNKHPWIYGTLLAIQIVVLTVLGILGLYLYMHLR